MTVNRPPIPPEKSTGLPQIQRRFLRRLQVQDLTGLKKSHLYAMAKSGRFPRQVKLGEKAAGWVEQEVAGWIDSRVNASRQNVARVPDAAIVPSSASRSQPHSTSGAVS